MKTIIPAQPGFFAVYPDGGIEPIIAWGITYSRDTCGFDVWPITPAGDAGDDHEVNYIPPAASPLWTCKRGAK
jgi:hypothetical protein